jgi:hypothetical protein
MSHLLNDQAKENWFEQALEHGLSDQDAEDFVDWNTDNEGCGSVADYVYFYLREDLAPRGTLINIKT